MAIRNTVDLPPPPAISTQGHRPGDVRETLRSVSHEEQQAARDAAWEERRRVVAHADFCAHAHRQTRPDIADALLAFGREIEDEVHL